MLPYRVPRRRPGGYIEGQGLSPTLLLAAFLVAILSSLWFLAVFRFLGADAWGEPATNVERPASGRSSVEGESK